MLVFDFTGSFFGVAVVILPTLLLLLLPNACFAFLLSLFACSC